HPPRSTPTLIQHSYHHHPNLHSFPTRRSSDLERDQSQHGSQRFPERDGTRRETRRPQTNENRDNGSQKVMFVHERAGQQINENSDRKSTRLNSSHVAISYAVFCLKKKIVMLHY